MTMLVTVLSFWGRRGWFDLFWGERWSGKGRREVWRPWSYEAVWALHVVTRRRFEETQSILKCGFLGLLVRALVSQLQPAILSSSVIARWTLGLLQALCFLIVSKHLLPPRQFPLMYSFDCRCWWLHLLQFLHILRPSVAPSLAPPLQNSDCRNSGRWNLSACPGIVVLP